MKRASLLLASLTFIIFLKAQNVGIGTNIPTYPLTVISDGSNKGIVQKSGSTELGFYVSGANAYVQTWSPSDLYFTTNNGNAKIAIANATGYVGIAVTTPSAQLDVNGTFRIRGNGAGANKVLTSDATGNATWQTPSGPGNGFRAYLTSDISRPAGSFSLINFTEDFDDGFNFNAVTGIFTAPSAGVYHFTANAGWGTAPAGSTVYYTTRIVVEFAGGNNDFIVQNGFPVTHISGYGNNFICSGDYKLGVGDKVHVDVNHNYGSNISLSSNGSSQTTFSGFKIY